MHDLGRAYRSNITDIHSLVTLVAKKQQTTQKPYSEDQSVVTRFVNKFDNLQPKEQMYWYRLGITFLVGSLLGVANLRGLWGFLVFFAYQALTAVWFQKKYPNEHYTFRQALMTGLITSLFLFVFSWTFWFNIFYANSIVPNWQNL